MTNLTWDTFWDMVMAAGERRCPPLEPSLVSSERYDKMMCEICKSDLTLCSEADRKRLEYEKWEQRRYEIARDIYVQYRDQTPEAALMCTDKLIKKLRETKDDPSA